MVTEINHTRTEKLLLEAARVFNSTLDYEELMECILKLVTTAVNAEAALVFRIDHDRPDLKIRFMKCVDCKMQTFSRHIEQGLFGWVGKYRETVIVNESDNDPRVDRELEKLVDLPFRSVLAVPLVGRGQMIGVVEAINSTKGGFTEADLDMLTGLNNQIAVAIANAHLYRELKREALEKDLLYEAGKRLSESLKLDDVLQRILDSLRQVVHFAVGSVFLIEPESDEVCPVATISDDPEYEEKCRLKFGQGIVGQVARTGDAVIVSDVSKSDQYIRAHGPTKSEIVVPISLDGRILGVINLESEEVNGYDAKTLALVSAFASQAAISLERARLHDSSLEGKKLEEQLNIAREIQRSFLPDADPVVNGYDITGWNFSSGQVGGDYYDFIEIVDHQMSITIADVAGKGVPAALIMASFRASLIAEIRNNYSIRTVCEKVNSLLFESLESGNFVTAVHGVLDSRNHIYTYANCGHNLPFVLRADDSVLYLREGGPVLGVQEGATYEEQAIILREGDILVLYTDGVTEVFGSDGAEFGLERLIEVVKQHREQTAVEIREAVHAAVKQAAGREHMFDDITMVIAKRLA